MSKHTSKDLATLGDYAQGSALDEARDAWASLTRSVAYLNAGRIRRVLESSNTSYGLPASEAVDDVYAVELYAKLLRQSMEQLVREGDRP